MYRWQKYLWAETLVFDWHVFQLACHTWFEQIWPFQKSSLSCQTLPCNPMCAAIQPGNVFRWHLCLHSLYGVYSNYPLVGPHVCILAGRPPCLPCDNCFADSAAGTQPEPNVSPHQMPSGSRGYLHLALPFSSWPGRVSLALCLKAQTGVQVWLRSSSLEQC